RLTSALRARARTIQVAGGVLMAFGALVIYNGWAESLQTKVPGYAKWVQDKIEGNSEANDTLARLRHDQGKRVLVASKQSLANVKLKDYGKAPDLQGISAWINSPPLDLRNLRRKVVLVDFWTYSCINCLRTLPYLEKWDSLYRSKGLVI